MKKLLVAVTVSFVLLAGGCSMFHKQIPQEQAAPRKESPNVVFYTFPDIPVPKELTLQMEKSFIYETPNLKAGVLVLTGNVDVASLENYFKINMVKNGWRFVNSYKYGNLILNFTKEDRTSNIRTTRDTFNTQVEIWVGPVDKVGFPQTAPREDGFK